MHVTDLIKYLYNEYLPQPIPGSSFHSKEDAIEKLSGWYKNLPEGWTFEVKEGESDVIYDIICPHGESIVEEEICRKDYSEKDLEEWEWYGSGMDLGCSICEEELLAKRKGGKENKKSEKSETIKVGRNEPCPCGSGKKYKKCCLNKISSMFD